jgi:anaerobic ribonucleoside-triphosphate reductase
MENLICHDCGHVLDNDEEYMPYDTTTGMFYKCKVCHIEDPILRNYRKTEVYARPCGYIRPIENWNPGKVAEFQDRKTYKI